MRQNSASNNAYPRIHAHAATRQLSNSTGCGLFTEHDFVNRGPVFAGHEETLGLSVPRNAIQNSFAIVFDFARSQMSHVNPLGHLA